MPAAPKHAPALAGGPGLEIQTAGKPSQADVLKQRHYGSAMQTLADFKGKVRQVDTSRTYSDTGSTTSNILQMYYSSE